MLDLPYWQYYICIEQEVYPRLHRRNLKESKEKSPPYYIKFRLYLRQLPLQHISCQSWCHIGFKNGNQFLTLCDGSIGCLQEEPFDFVLGERWRSAFFTVELVIALPNDPPVFICGMPDL